MTASPQPPSAPAALVDREHAIHLLHEMLRIRRFEEKCAEPYQAEKIRGFLHLYIGEEAVGVGVMQALTREDAVVATYREHGQAIARGLSMQSVMAEMFGKAEGCSCVICSHAPLPGPLPTGPSTCTGALPRPTLTPTLSHPHSRPPGRGRPRAPPRPRAHAVARKMAEELRIDLAKITGTGAGGVITKADVEAAAARPAPAEAPEAPPDRARDRAAAMRRAIAAAMEPRRAHGRPARSGAAGAHRHPAQLRG